MHFWQRGFWLNDKSLIRVSFTALSFEVRFLYTLDGCMEEVGGTKPNNNRPVKKMSVHKIVLVISMINDLKGVFLSP